MLARFYSLEVIVYSTTKDIAPLIEQVKDLKHYAMITHDKDVYQDTGEIKKTHTHIICTFIQRKSFQSCSKNFNEIFNKIGLTILPENITNIKTDLKSAYDYLTHKNSLDKYQYDETEIISDSKESFNNESNEEDNNAYRLVCDILQGTFSTRELLKKYGREFVINGAYYYDIAKRINREEENAFNMVVYEEKREQRQIQSLLNQEQENSKK